MASLLGTMSRQQLLSERSASGTNINRAHPPAYQNISVLDSSNCSEAETFPQMFVPGPKSQIATHNRRARILQPLNL
jgi:hypothetical protein